MNKWRNKALKLITISAFPLLAIATSTQPSNASTFDVTCKANKGTPTIVASLIEKGSTQEDTILQFLPEYFSPNEAISKCQTTANKLQELYKTDNISYLSSDTIDGGQSVVCAVTRRGSKCDSYSSEILFTLAQGTDPTLALYDMLDNSIKQSNPRPDSRTVSRMYTDITPSFWDSARGRGWWPF
ncbi:COP23 domain-containing protein [Pleurocapsa sp. PCC 7319]|uniref:COP23 domain-containing protein n=1 Tax=Pleurocapsa sp. PCC 7319 TaxID=118161 RepID=UPI0003461B28|nr:COP23 domain-containing protein [Pleurocapsa sp. PCC 7319]